MENEPLIESSFRRLLVAIENERDALRTSWKSLNDEREARKKENQRLKDETINWCQKERDKIDAKMKEVEDIRQKVSLLTVDDDHVFKLTVADQEIDVPRSVLTALPESNLAHMFADEFVSKIPKIKDRYVVDFHPLCFRIVVNYLHAVSLARRTKQPEPAVPHVPIELRVPMAVMVDAFKLDQFLAPNSICSNGTSLLVESGSTVKATCQGWQVLNALQPLNPAKESGFTVKIVSNPDPRGGLAIGVVGQSPTGLLVHQLMQPSGIIYNSNNGIVQSQAVESNDTQKGLPFKEGTTVMVKFTPKQRKVQWVVNGQSIGFCTVRAKDDTAELFPCFALFSPGQIIKVEFRI